MGTRTKDLQKTAKKDQDSLIESFLKDLAGSLLKDAKDIRKAAEATKLSRSAIEQMKIYAKGSATSWVKLIAHALDIEIKDLPGLTAKFKSTVSNFEKLTDFESIMEEARKRYSDGELYIWLRLLIARHEIEEELGFHDRHRKK